MLCSCFLSRQSVYFLHSLIDVNEFYEYEMLVDEIMRVWSMGKFFGLSVVKYLLGGLLLLLLLATLRGCVTFGRGFGGGLFWGRGLLLLLLSATGNEQTDHILGGKETIVVNFELAEDIIDLGLGELVTEVQQSVPEHLGLDLAVGLVSLEGPDNQIVGIVGT